jgi:hypothetical protein
VQPLGPRTDSLGNTSLGAYTTGAGGGPGANGVLGTVHLKPLGKAGILSLQVANVLLSDVNGNPTAPVVLGASVVITQGQSLYLPVIRR